MVNLVDIEEGIPKGYIKIMQGIYSGAAMRVRMVCGAIFKFPVGVGLL